MKKILLTSCLLWLFAGLASAQSPPAHWIWTSDAADQVYLSKMIDVGNDPIAKATAVISADNRYRLRVNGPLVSSGDSWERPDVIDLTKQLRAGTNLIQIDGVNDGGIAALLMELRITYANKKEARFVTDTTWSGSTKSHQEGLQPVRSIGLATANDLAWSGRVNDKVIDDLFAESSGAGFVPTVVNDVTTPAGFVVEKVYNVPRSSGSWVAITTDDQGRLIASDQGGAGLFRIVPGQVDRPTEVTKLPLDISGAQGLLWAFDSLYIMVNGGPKSGLHRAKDTNGDGELDSLEFIVPLEGGGEHGPHAVIVAPDKKSLLICAGNHTKLPKEIANSRIPQNWNEDHLLPRRWDANGHAAGILAPGGWICRIDPDGKNRDVQSIGFRNQYDIALNADNELFSYDADMEWDLGSPWYRPTRVVHATSGSEFGWRSGTGKWPAYYEDSLPAAIDIGPGSPVGIQFGYGTKFPAKYQRALFILDWTYSTIYAIHLTPEGASYRGEKEDFVVGQPLQVTDATVGKDGALYFATGGRGTQSAVYRVVYRGDESVAAVDAKDTQGAQERARRRAIEAEHGQENANDIAAIDSIIESLGDADRFVRYAARIALETRPIASWKNKALNLSDDRAKVNAAIAIARQGSEADRGDLLKLLANVAADKVDPQTRLGWLRAYQLAFTRLGQPTDQERESVLAILDRRYPSPADSENAELAQLLVYLNAPHVVERTLQLIENAGPEPVPAWGYLVDRNKGYGGTVGSLLENMTPARGIHFAFVLRNQKTGWTIDQRRRYFEFFVKASKHPGGNSYAKFLEQMRDDALATCSVEERVLVDNVASVSLVAAPPKVDPPKGPGREWTRDMALTMVTGLKDRNFDQARNLFHAAQCAKCHRLGGEGGAIGPDLSTAGRKFSPADMLDAIIEPSKAISDQYGSTQVLTASGQSVIGRMVKLDGKLHIYTADADKPPVVIAEDDVEAISESKISQMPAGLINSLNENELKDLMAYLLSGGNRRDKMFKQ